MRGWGSPVLSKNSYQCLKMLYSNGETQTFPWGHCASFHLALYFNCSNRKKILKIENLGVCLFSCNVSLKKKEVVNPEHLQGLSCGNTSKTLASHQPEHWPGVPERAGLQESFGLRGGVTQNHRNSHLQNSDRVPPWRGTKIKFCSSVNTISLFSLKDQFFYSMYFPLPLSSAPTNST